MVVTVTEGVVLPRRAGLAERVRERDTARLRLRVPAALAEGARRDGVLSGEGGSRLAVGEAVGALLPLVDGVAVALDEGVPVALDEPVPVSLPVPVALDEGVPLALNEPVSVALDEPVPV